jgi:hypothetical protein
MKPHKEVVTARADLSPSRNLYQRSPDEKKHGNSINQIAGGATWPQPFSGFGTGGSPVPFSSWENK